MREYLERTQLNPAEFYRALFEECPDGVIGVDSGGKIIFVTPHTEKIFGASPGQMTGLLIEDLVPVPIRLSHKTEREIYQVHPKNRSMGIGLDLFGRRLDDGSEFPVDISLSPVEINGESFVVAWVRDVGSRLSSLDIRRMTEALRAISSVDDAKETVSNQTLANQILKRVDDARGSQLIYLTFLTFMVICILVVVVFK